MTPVLRNILIFTVTLAVTLTSYYFLRSRYMEKSFLEKMPEKMEMIRPAAEIMGNQSSPDPERTKKIFNEIMKQEPSIAAMAFTDRYGSLKYLIKNDSIIKSGRTVDLLINDIKDESLVSENVNSPVIRTYDNGRGGKERYFISSHNRDGNRTYIVFSQVPGKKLMIRIVFEILLVLSFSFTFTGMILTILKKKGITEDIHVKTIVLGAKKNKPEKGAGVDKQDILSGEASQIDENDLTPVMDSETGKASSDILRKSRPDTGAASDAMNTRIFGLFREMHRELGPESISLYIKKMEGRLSKTWELKEKTFLKIDSSLFDNIKISEIENMKKPGAAVTDEGKTVRIPVLDDESLIGLVEIRLKDSSASPDLGKLISTAKGISKEIKDFLVINNVIIDRETGFYSSSYFNMKLSEQIYSAQKIETGFFLLLIDPFAGLDLDPEQRNTVLKIIYPVIKKSSGEMHELFLHSGKIALILPGAGRPEAEDVELSVSKDISKFRIKLSTDKIIRLKPVAAIMDSSEADSVKDILNETLKIFETEI